MAYPPLPDGSPDELERALLERWKDEDLFQRTLEANREAPPFVFYEGPPTANGMPHNGASTIHGNHGLKKFAAPSHQYCM